MFNVKQLKMNKFIKYICQLIISASNATPPYAPLFSFLNSIDQIIIDCFG